ncbi:unnamed protein product [Rangifer tarandus platyrhynchus]|uniref:Uncharacterized protein n=2 Tax=Rangifer tarandus platyrhynchus TaxID=3082113 RepID=A0ABN9A0W7_RANTA|nr:unnamed protein product [Rangifer tarandus platyrhynchus]CAI9714304.1 unnamed protein product [Rangifer tarandus platyrhynchus]
MVCAEPSDRSEHLPQVSTRPSTSHQPSQRSAFTGSVTKAQAQERLTDAQSEPPGLAMEPGPAAATTPGDTADQPLKGPHKNTPTKPEDAADPSDQQGRPRPPSSAGWTGLGTASRPSTAPTRSD